MLMESDLREQIKLIRDKLEDHDIQLNQIYDVPMTIGREFAGRKIRGKKWKERERIGFKPVKEEINRKK